MAYFILAFDLHFCGVDLNDEIIKEKLYKNFKYLKTRRKHLVQTHKEQFHDLFSKDKLVYITSGAKVSVVITIITFIIFCNLKFYLILI